MKLRYWIPGCITAVIIGFFLKFTTETILIALIVNLIIGIIAEVIIDRKEKYR